MEWWGGGRRGEGLSPFSRRVCREPDVKNFQHFVICFCSPFATTSLNAPAVLFCFFCFFLLVFFFSAVRSRRNAADKKTRLCLEIKILRCRQTFIRRASEKITARGRSSSRWRCCNVTSAWSREGPLQSVLSMVEGGVGGRGVDGGEEGSEVIVRMVGLGGRGLI